MTSQGDWISIGAMPRRPSKTPPATEANRIAAEVADVLTAATGGAAPLTIEGVKNPAAKPKRARLLKRVKKTKKGVGARRRAK